MENGKSLANVEWNLKRSITKSLVVWLNLLVTDFSM
jgi:hypothetical protein